MGQKIVEAAREVTQICTDEKILGYPSHKGVIVLDDIRGLFQDFANKLADVTMTTEIYPDKSPIREAEDTQLAVIKRAISFALEPACG